MWMIGLGIGGAALGGAVLAPNLVEARKHGDGAAAIGALKSLNTSQTQLREGDKEGDCTFDDRTATPSGATAGDRSFTTNHGGTIYYTPSENAWQAVEGEAVRTTFSIDVDTASYTTIRAILQRRLLPSPDLVRVEEMINAFDYAYAPPMDDRPFAAHVEGAACPWRAGHRLVRIALKGREVAPAVRPPANLVFLVDVSGSMAEPAKLPLVQESLRQLVGGLGERDSVALVVYAGASGLVLPPTPGDRKASILEAIGRLQAGGSTNGGAGIQLAYETAARAWKQGGVNRVLLLTDGDWNVGVTQGEALEALIARKAESGVFLSVLGFGMGHRDDTLERLADRGNGHHAFIDTADEARRHLVDHATGTLVTIAKDVKLQLAWDPSRVRSYRLIGYEDRALANRDFADDAKDAGELGAGHTVTALYELEVVDGDGPLGALDLRWKAPDGATSQLMTVSLDARGGAFEDASPDLRFATAVAAFGLLLRGSAHAGEATLGWARQAADGARGDDPRRAELVGLIDLAIALREQSK
jgi:Ca-activated chloride channel homolog